MADIVLCECGRRYLRATIAIDMPEEGSELCECERSLGEWSGLTRYVFEPERDGD